VPAADPATFANIVFVVATSLSQYLPTAVFFRLSDANLIIIARKWLDMHEPSKRRPFKGHRRLCLCHRHHLESDLSLLLILLLLLLLLQHTVKAGKKQSS